MKQFNNQQFLAHRIQQMRQAYIDVKDTVLTAAAVTADRFTEQDRAEFDTFVQDVLQEALQKINGFFEQRAQRKCESFEAHNSKMQNQFRVLVDQLTDFKAELAENFARKDVKRRELQERNENIAIAFRRQNQVRASFNALRKYAQRKTLTGEDTEFCRQHYVDTLLKKSFQGWRGAVYRQAWENKIKKSSEDDIDSIKKQYEDIVNILQSKIDETEAQIQKKREEKADFAYNLSKNLMKAIQNLQSEVLNLNTVSLRDNQIDVSESQRFLQQMNQVLEEKYKGIRNIRQEINQQLDQPQNRTRTQQSAQALRFSDQSYEGSQRVY